MVAPLAIFLWGGTKYILLAPLPLLVALGILAAALDVALAAVFATFAIPFDDDDQRASMAVRKVD